MVAVSAPGRRLPAACGIGKGPGLLEALFSTHAQFGTAEDVTLAEMRIELMFPADAETESRLLGLQADGD